jgi:hypothetical protein
MKEIRKKSGQKAALKNKDKKYAEAARSDNALQHTPKSKPNPIVIAKNLLGDRLQEIIMCDGISWELDGKPTGLSQVMQAANRIRVNIGMEQIKDSPAWVI